MMQSCRQEEIIGRFKVQDGKRRKRKKGGKEGGGEEPKIVSKAGGHLGVGPRGHQRHTGAHAGASMLEGNIHLVPFTCL